MKTRLKLFLSAVALTLSLVNAYGQISIKNTTVVPSIKKGTTYVILKDPESEGIEEYIDVYKKYWTLSKIDFIRYSEIDKYISPENSFIYLEAFKITSIRTYDQSMKISEDLHAYLKFWTYMLVKNKDGKSSHRIVNFANIQLDISLEGHRDPSIIHKDEPYLSKHIRNLGPGMLKNYIQVLTTYLNNGETRNFITKITNKTELKNLKNETLYVPDYVMIKNFITNFWEPERHNPKKIFKKYKYKYEIIPDDELNKKILEDKERFYYMIFVKNHSFKFVNVVNSRTGEIIYLKAKHLTKKLKKRDLKRLRKKIN